MKAILKAGDRTRAICEDCGVVDVRCERCTYRLSEPAVDVPDVPLGVCTKCDHVVIVPSQSSPALNEARGAAEAGTG